MDSVLKGVQREIDRIAQNVANAYAVLLSLGAEMPEEQNSDNLAQTAGTTKVVLYSPQTLTEGEKTQARANIGVVGTGKDGVNGQRGTGILKVTTAPSSYTTAIGDYTPKYRIALSTVKSQSGVDEVLVGDLIQYSYYHYHVDYLDSTYAYISATRVSIRGATGAAGADGATTAEVIAAMTKETWTFTLEDGSTVTKVVPLV